MLEKKVAEEDGTSRVIVFAGPCLPRRPDSRWRGALEDFEVWPPAQRGDVLRALGEQPAALILLDGLYYSVPSVTHKELLYALDSGVTVVGAASMGALRAVEMESFGMVGVGRVFELFRSGTLDGDDEVAMLHGLEEHGYRPLTLALVEVRHALEEMLKELNLPSSAGGAFLAAAKALPFTERSQARLLTLAEQHLAAKTGPEATRELFRRVASKGIKQADALQALESIKKDLAGKHRTARKHRQPPLVTTLFNHFREWYLGPSTGTGRDAPSFLQAWQVTQLFHPGVPDFLDFLRRRFLLASAAEAAGLQPAPEHLEEITRDLLQHLGSCPLPALELAAEAQLEALAQTATIELEGDAVETAGKIMAKRFGLDATGGSDQLLKLLSLQGDLMPPWFLARSFLFTAAREPALSLAEAAYQVLRAFSTWTRGGRLSSAEVQRVAAKIFGCELAQAESEAAKRGLLNQGGAEDRTSPGSLADAVALVAAAERLPKAANEYPHCRGALVGAKLEAPFLQRLQEAKSQEARSQEAPAQPIETR